MARVILPTVTFKIYRTIILSVVLNGCETWSLKLREERRLRVFENRVLRRVFGPKRDEVTGEWRKLRNEELSDLYLRERDHWRDPDVDERIILRWIFRKWEGVVGTGWSWLRIGTGGGRLWVR